MLAPWLLTATAVLDRMVLATALCPSKMAVRKAELRLAFSLPTTPPDEAMAERISSSTAATLPERLAAMRSVAMRVALSEDEGLEKVLAVRRVGAEEGSPEGWPEGCPVGLVGCTVGCPVGCLDGCPVGWPVGLWAQLLGGTFIPDAAGGSFVALARAMAGGTLPEG